MTQMVEQTRFQKRLKREKDLFIPFIMGGDPTPEATVEIAYTMQQSGADVLELGVPYSDPLADGPTIQEAAGRALAQGMNLTEAMKLVPKMRERGVTIPVVLFTYYNPVLRYGLEAFAKAMEENDVDGLLIPDIPLEESEDIRGFTEQYGVELISLVAPNSEERIKRIAEQAKGFLYCVSSLGVTGERKDMNPDIASFLEKVKQYSQVPVAVGFGISSYEQVKLVQGHSDGVIIGSKIIKLIDAHREALSNEGTRAGALQELQSEVEQLVKGNE